MLFHAMFQMWVVSVIIIIIFSSNSRNRSIIIINLSVLAWSHKFYFVIQFENRKFVESCSMFGLGMVMEKG